MARPTVKEVKDLQQGIIACANEIEAAWKRVCANDLKPHGGMSPHQIITNTTSLLKSYAIGLDVILARGKPREED